MAEKMAHSELMKAVVSVADFAEMTDAWSVADSAVHWVALMAETTAYSE